MVRLIRSGRKIERAARATSRGVSRSYREACAASSRGRPKKLARKTRAVAAARVAVATAVAAPAAETVAEIVVVSVVGAKPRHEE